MIGLGIKIAGKTKKQIMELIKKSPIPTRYKKFLQGETLEEAKVKPMAKGHRSTVPYELRAFTAGAGLSLPAIYSYLTSEKKQSTRNMAEAMGMKPKPKKKVSNVPRRRRSRGKSESRRRRPLRLPSSRAPHRDGPRVGLRQEGDSARPEPHTRELGRRRQ